MCLFIELRLKSIKDTSNLHLRCFTRSIDHLPYIIFLKSKQKKVHREKLKVDGYKIEFPQTWDAHGQARLICYVSDNIKYSRKVFDESLDHIPSITLEIGRGKATRTTVHYYYREGKNGVTGEGDAPSQLAHLRKHISQWQEIANTGRNFVTLGDANLCALTWNETDYKLKDLSNEVQMFNLR